MNYLNSNLIFQICRNYCTGRPVNRPRPVSRPGQWPRPPASGPAQTGCQAGALTEQAGSTAGNVGHARVRLAVAEGNLESAARGAATAGEGEEGAREKA